MEGGGKKKGIDPVFPELIVYLNGQSPNLVNSMQRDKK
jgi:hypothetical protein